MADSQSNPDRSTLSKHSNVIETTTTSTDVVYPRRRIPQSFLVVWLDPYINESKQDYQNMVIQLRNVASNLHIFNQRDECIDFLTDAYEEKVFLITDGVTGKEVIPLINDLATLDTIYILCQDKLEHEQWVKRYTKVQVYTDIKSVCNTLQQVMKQTNRDFIAMSFVPLDQDTATQNLDQLEPLFMYTQLFKEVLLTMEYGTESIKSFASYCRNGNYGSKKTIDRFEKEYLMHSPIWWYTFPSFIFEILNAALRMLEAETMIEMGFFLCDLQNEIEKLYQQQVVSQRRNSFIVYRGQGLSTADFGKLLKTENGLLSFNNFLSTSEKYDFSFDYAEMALTKTDTIGVLFKIFVDPSISSIPFAFVEQLSYFRTEAEVLFSMHSIFRIGHIEKIASNRELYLVDLKLTADDDPQLRLLTDRIREETTCPSGMNRLCLLLIKIGKFDKAEYLCEMLLNQNLDPSDEAYFYNNLGYLKSQQSDQESALLLHRRALQIHQKSLPPNHPDLASSYNNIASVYDNMGEYSKAVSFHQKALQIHQKSLPPNHPHLASSYNNIASVYDKMGEYSKALSFHEKALEMYQKSLPPNHPDLAISYNNIGLVYYNMGEYSKSLSFHEKALEMREKSLPSNHPDLAISYNNIASVYDKMGEYSKALSFHEKALEMYQKSLPPNHPDLAISYNNIGLVYDKMGEYSKALSFHEKALEMRQKSLPSNHPDLAISYNNIASVYGKMGEYSKALSFHEKALEMYQKSLPPNHPDLASSYHNIASVYYNMGEYSKALTSLEKALDIRQKSLPPNHPDLADSYNNIASVYGKMGEYSKALPFYEKALEMRQKSLPSNHPDLASSYHNIASVYYNMGEYSKALSFYEKALEMRQKSLPSNHPDLADSYNSIASVYNNMGEYSKALSFHEKALEMRQKSLPSNHPDLASSYNNIASVYYNMGEWSKALSLFKRSLNILQASLPSNHPYIKLLQENIECVKRNL